MSVSRWEPMKDFMTLRQAMDRLFEDSFVRPGRVLDGSSATYLPLDVYTTKDAVVIRASVPGGNPKDVEITVEGSTVTIRGEIKPQKEEGSYLLQEQRYGPFVRSIDIALPIQADIAEASFKNGLLTLTIPKGKRSSQRSSRSRACNRQQMKSRDRSVPVFSILKIAYSSWSSDSLVE